MILGLMDQRCAPRSFDQGKTGLAWAVVSKARAWPAMVVALVAVFLAAGCSHPVIQGETQRPNLHPVPFRDAGQAAAAVPDSGVPSKADAVLPFHDVESLPPGTLLAVHLASFVSAGPGSPFEAVLDEPIRINGKVVIPQGTTVSGHVESAQISDVEKNRGSIRLDLESIIVGGRELPLQTSSLFARVTPHLIFTDGGKSSTNVMTLEKGRRLTFRLTEPVYLAAQRSAPTP